jgi:signal transduction histidine kinase
MGGTDSGAMFPNPEKPLGPGPGIYPPLLTDHGLVAALTSQARKAPLPVDVVANGLGRYPLDAEAAVYLCRLEALQNVAKYAGATHAVVRLFGDGSHVEFSVEDNGVGFHPETAKRGSGLTNMGDRITALGGTFEMRSHPGAGATTVRIGRCSDSRGR